MKWTKQAYGLDLSHMSEDLRVAKTERAARLEEERRNAPKEEAKVEGPVAPRQRHRAGRVSAEVGIQNKDVSKDEVGASANVIKEESIEEVYASANEEEVYASANEEEVYASANEKEEVYVSPKQVVQEFKYVKDENGPAACPRRWVYTTRRLILT
jgi:hypothetical protein